MKQISLFLVLLWLSQTLCLAKTSQATHIIDLPLNSSISLPADWVVQDGEFSVKVDEYARKMVQSAGASPLELAATKQLLVANYPNQEKYAGLTVTSEGDSTVSRDIISSMTQSEIAQTGEALSNILKHSLGSAGISTKNWSPMTRVRIGNRAVLMISYVRVSALPDTRAIQYMFSGDGIIFTVTTSTVISNEATMAETLFEIVQSFTY